MVTFGQVLGWLVLLDPLVLLTNVSPQMGQPIVKSFLVTVVGGVGNFFGVVFCLRYRHDREIT